jgi:LytS/YehU family sensor histidine kinase
LIASPAALVWYFVWFHIVTGVLAIVTLGELRRRRQAVNRLAAVQEQSRATRQQLAHSKLQAIQARVDPRFLFDMLGAVKRLYGLDAQRAERLLDELNAFLRAALPRLRSARSSLGVEVELVASQQRLVQNAFDVPVGFAPRLPEALSDAVFPAGVLLPLTAPQADHGAHPIELEAEAAEQRLRVSVATARTPDDATLDRLRAALADLYGEHAGLRLVPGPRRGGGQATIVELELPHERD